jgi:hypothetical protein
MTTKAMALLAAAACLVTVAATAAGQSIRIGARAAKVASVDPRLLPSAPAEVEEEGVETPPMPLPADLPVPAAFAWRSPMPAAETFDNQFAPQPESATVARSFLALTDNNTFTPPDTSGAAGPNHLVVALNTQLRFQTRTGTEVLSSSLRTFFDPIRNDGRVFDPHVAYDARTNRWILCATSDQKISSTAKATGSGFLLGISKTADPTGLWDLYRYAAPDDTVWFDFPQLGFNDATIVVSLNVYQTADDKFVRAAIYQVSRADPSSATVVDYPNNGGGFAPVTSYDGGSVSYIVQRWNGSSGGNGFLRLYSLSSAGITPIAFVSTPFPWTGSGANGDDFAPQAGTAQKIAAGDDRILSPILRNGSIWAVHTVFTPLGAPTRASTQWWQIAPSGALLQRGILDDVTSTFSYTFPSIAVNTRNDVVIAGTRFSATTTFPSAFYIYRPAGTPATTASQPVIFRSGDAPYNKIINTTSTSNRWGDYSATCVDPVNGVDFWTIQEYAGTPLTGVDRWGTWWVQLTISDAAARRRAAKH